MTITQPTRDIIPTLIQWATERNPIRAVLLTSTRAIPDAPVDALSDSDVILIAQDLHPFVAERTWLNDFGDVLVVYWDPIRLDPVFGIEQCGCVTQYADGLKIDFTLWPIALFQHIVAAPVLPAELDAGYRVLLDEGDKVAGRFVGRSIHRGDFMGIAPTGKEVLMRGIIIFHISEGQIVEDWVEADFLTLMQQLGVIPPMEGKGG